MSWLSIYSGTWLNAWMSVINKIQFQRLHIKWHWLLIFALSAVNTDACIWLIVITISCFDMNVLGSFKPTQYLDVIGQVADNQNPFLMHLQIIHSLPIQFLGKSNPMTRRKEAKFNAGLFIQFILYDWCIYYSIVCLIFVTVWFILQE